MGRKPIGERAMTPAERQARHREQTPTRTQALAWRRALEQIADTEPDQRLSATEARILAIAMEALAYH